MNKTSNDSWTNLLGRNFIATEILIWTIGVEICNPGHHENPAPTEVVYPQIRLWEIAVVFG